MTRLKTLKPTLATLNTRIAPPAPKIADPFYHSRPWRTLLAQIIAERGRRCEECGATSVRIYGDHIVERRDGGAELDKRNVLLRCAPCHGRKSAREREKRLGL